jgi:acetyltransferase-like isoleucine patch superfamily enzyme
VRALKDVVLRRLALRGTHVSHGANLHVGPGSVIWAPRSLTIGRDVYVGKHCTIQVDGVIGDGVLIANAVGVVGRRDHDHRALGSVIRHAPWVGDDPARLSLPTCIHSDVWLGYGAIVLSGVHVGRSSIIGAGSVVYEDVPENVVAVGNPARPVSSRFSPSEFETHWRSLHAAGIRDPACVVGRP